MYGGKGKMNGTMKLSETKTLYDLLENAGRLYSDKVFLKYEIEEEVYEKTYAEFVTDAKKQHLLSRRKRKKMPVRFMQLYLAETVMNTFAH